METAEDIQARREQVLKKYDDFKESAKGKRQKLEDSRRFQYFLRDAFELESWINEKLKAASDDSHKDTTNLQAKIQKHQAFEAEVSAHSNVLVALDDTGEAMIQNDHYKKAEIRDRLEEIHRLWELLLQKLAEKGLKLQQALILLQYLRQADEVIFWIKDKEVFLSNSDFGHDLEHVEVLQRKFEEFQKDLHSQEYRVVDVCKEADELMAQNHPDCDQILEKKQEMIREWENIKILGLKHQENLNGSHEIMLFVR